MIEIEKKVMQTIAYFDVFDYPLTASELHRYLYADEKCDLIDIIKFLDINKSLESYQGFYFFKSRKEIVKKRKERYLIANKKIRKNLKYIRMISKLPFVRAVFICNTLSYLNAKNGSDIDLAVVAGKGKIWTARFFCALLMKIFNKRPTEDNQKDKICLSFYFSEEKLDLGSIKKENDIHFVYWVAQFLMVYGEEKMITEFSDKNSWIKKYLPNHYFTIVNSRWRIGLKSRIKKVLESFLGFSVVERVLKKIQMKKIPRELTDQAEEENSNVIISDTVLKLHKKDNRNNIQKKWEEKTRKMLSSG